MIFNLFLIFLAICLLLSICFCIILFIAKILVYHENKEIKNSPFPESWQKILTDNFRAYRFLPENLKYKLHYLVKEFIKKKKFIGIGITITDEIKVTVAAQACIIILGKKNYFYPQLSEIIIYPTSVETNIEIRKGNNLEIQKTIFAGYCKRGSVHLSWIDTKFSAELRHDGYNLVIHEFAHQLDFENEDLDGIPLLPPAMCYKTWTIVMEKHFVKMANSIAIKEKSLLRDYGASSPVEFFAVLTETFFERPVELFELHHDLYEIMKNYYGLNPIEWKVENELPKLEK